MNLREISIDDIELSVRSRNALHNAGTNTVEEMLQWTEESLSSVRNLGAKSINEILDKIEEYKGYFNLTIGNNFDAWILTEEGKDIVKNYCKKNNFSIESLELLSTKSFNLLMINGFNELQQLIDLSKDRLMFLPKMDNAHAEEIVRLTSRFIYDHKEKIICYMLNNNLNPQDSIVDIEESFRSWVCTSDNRENVHKYVVENNKTIEEMCFSNRGKNRLLKEGYEYLSDIIFITKDELLNLPSMGTNSVDDILNKIDNYLEKNESRIRSFCSGDVSALWTDEFIEEKILNLYNNAPFVGFNVDEYINYLELPEHVDIKRLKNILGRLIFKGKLEYVDYRCYRIYEKFETYMHKSDVLTERDKLFIQKRLDGLTLEAIGHEANVTRERVRQIIKKGIIKLRDRYQSEYGTKWFEEDYYRYFYENYAVSRNIAIEWLGFSEAVFRYLLLIDITKGSKQLNEALEDRKIDAGLRLKIKTYENRNKILIDGRYIEKRRIDLEEYFVKNYCKNDITFSEFVEAYNTFLKVNVIEESNLYITEEVYFTRKNILAESKKVLWKLGEKLRYYDIEGQDYSELLDTLNLESYKNIELSTLKFYLEYPDVMKHYDIRNQYELHNLLKKIIPNNMCEEFSFGRNPTLKFGTFDRENALYELLKINAPISVENFVDLVHCEYGYSKETILGTYIQCLSIYNHQGIFTLSHKAMSIENARILKTLLTDDFYYIEEIEKLYENNIPNADIEEINAYNLKRLGFKILSNYVVQNFPSSEAYFEDLFTKEDIVDLSVIKKRYSTVVTYYGKLMEMKRNLEVIEFEPDKIINFRKLESADISREMIKDFCNKVYDFIESNTYFTMTSIKNMGFDSELYELGFSDWFYGSLLLSDERFSFVQTLGTRIFYKGNKSLMTKDFIADYINKCESIDVYELISILETEYGCIVDDRLDLIYKVKDSGVFYDKYLDRFYASEELFYEEIDNVKV